MGALFCFTFCFKFLCKYTIYLFYCFCLKMEHICQEIRKIFCLSDNIIIVPYEEAIGTVT